jgi:hypothetical protein
VSRAAIQNASATLDLIGSATIGVDELVAENVDEDGEVTTDPEAVVAVRETSHGQREDVLQVTVRAISQGLEARADVYLERLRTRLAWSSSLEALRAMGLGVSTVGAIVPLDSAANKAEMRKYSEAAIEIGVVFGVAESDEPGPFLQTAIARSQSVRDVDGTALPDGAQITTEP